MPDRLWSETDFQRWRLATGLSAERIAELLKVSDRTVQRMTDGTSQVRDDVALACRRYIRVSRTTDGNDGDTMDSVAEQAGWADICAKYRHLYVTGMSAAIARGWTSANMNKRLFVSQPPRMIRPETEGKTRLVWLPHSDMLYSVEWRDDTAGRPYRIANAELTLLDIFDGEGDYSVDEIVEVMKGAQYLAEQRIDVIHMRRLAALRGRSSEDRVNDWLRGYWKRDKITRYRKYNDDGRPADWILKFDERKFDETNRLRAQNDGRLPQEQRGYDETPNRFDRKQE